MTEIEEKENDFDLEIEQAIDNSFVSTVLLENTTLESFTDHKERKISDFLLKGEEEIYPLYYGENLIGREATNHIVIDDEFISREHACIFVEEGKITLFDFSTNGSCVNEEQVWNQEVKAGDIIDFWLNRFVLEQQYIDESVLLGLAAEAAYIHQSKVSRRLSTGFGLIELLIVAIIGILSAIAVANISSSRRAANSASAIQSLRVISSSQASYQAGAGNGEFASSDNLVKEQYIDQSLAAATLPTPSSLIQQPKSGYVFLFNTIANDSLTGVVASYEVSARPLVNGSLSSGNKSFFVDTTGVIRASSSSLAPYADSNSLPLE